MIISLVVAVAENGVIGANGRLPWRLPSDLKRSAASPLGKPVIMGRKTFQSIGKPLDGRDNIVVVAAARTSAAPGAVAVSEPRGALDHARRLAQARRDHGDRRRRGLPPGACRSPDRIYLTVVHGQPGRRCSFQVPPDGRWAESSPTPLPRGANDDFAAR